MDFYGWRDLPLGSLFVRDGRLRMGEEMALTQPSSKFRGVEGPTRLLSSYKARQPFLESMVYVGRYIITNFHWCLPLLLQGYFAFGR